MLRMPIKERENWKERAKEFGFNFHTMYGEKYWDESAYYSFTLQQIEKGIEEPTADVHQMCLKVVDRVVRNNKLMRLFQIPESLWPFVRKSWESQEPCLYSRLDFAYDGISHAKLYENNADTPTSLYETGFWQWLWLEDNVDSGKLFRNADQFNSLQEKLIKRFLELKYLNPGRKLHFASSKNVVEDRGTVQYMEDCAKQAGIVTEYVDIEDIGVREDSEFVDLDNEVITWIFKLYPWEFMHNESYHKHLGVCDISWLEPAWKTILSNKAILPLLWEMFEGHDNLLPAYFAHDHEKIKLMKNYVKKPIFSREGANITMFSEDKIIAASGGEYGDEGFVFQATKKLPKFEDNYTLIGSWLVDDKPAGISVREDSSLITQDMSRFLPHIIM